MKPSHITYLIFLFLSGCTTFSVRPLNKDTSTTEQSIFKYTRGDKFIISTQVTEPGDDPTRIGYPESFSEAIKQRNNRFLNKLTANLNLYTNSADKKLTQSDQNTGKLNKEPISEYNIKISLAGKPSDETFSHLMGQFFFSLATLFIYPATTIRQYDCHISIEDVKLKKSFEINKTIELSTEDHGAFPGGYSVDRYNIPYHEMVIPDIIHTFGLAG